MWRGWGRSAISGKDEQTSIRRWMYIYVLAFLFKSMFDFERYAAEAFPDEKSAFLGDSRAPVRRSGMQGRSHRGRMDDGKMEKSYLNFKQHHPNFSGDAASMSMMGQLQSYKDMKY